MILGICGGTCSGKTTLANELKNWLGEDKAVIIDQDSYYKDRSSMSKAERAEINYDHPDAIEFDLLVKHLELLKNKHSINKPKYNFKTHTRLFETEEIKSKKIIIVEGILIFSNKILKSLIDIKIALDIDAELRLVRRIKRDILERGRAMEDILEQYMNTVKPMFDEYVQPSFNQVDLIFKNNDIDFQIKEIGKLVTSDK